MEEALAYSRTLKKMLHDEQETYDEVFNIMRSYKRRMIDPASVTSKVQTLLHGRNDLILGFNRFLPKHHAITLHGDDDHKSPLMVSENVVCDDLQQFHNALTESAERCDKFSGKKYEDHGLINGNTHDHDNVQRVCETPYEESVSAIKSAIEFINRVRKSLNDDQMYKKFLDTMARYKRLKDLDDVEQEVSTLFKASPEIYIEFTTFLADAIAKKPTSTEANHSLPRSAKNGFKEINGKNLNEKIMNRYEDDMYEQDMLLHRVESTTEAMERLHQACEENSIERIEVEAHLSVINLRCIERLYDESGVEMVDILRDKPRAASRFILSRLRQKFDELKESCSQANRLRAKTIKKLHGKAYDAD